MDEGDRAVASLPLRPPRAPHLVTGRSPAIRSMPRQGIGSRLGRFAVILAATGAVGVAALPFQDAAALAKNSASPAPVLLARVPPASKGAHEPSPRTEGARTGHEAGRLKTLVEAGEQDAESKDWDGAATRADEAEVLVADWPEELLNRPDIAALMARLLKLEQHLPENGANPEDPDPGLKEATEAVPLSPAELKAELAQVASAEVGAVFDFPIDLNDKVLAWVHEFTTAKRGFMERTLTRSTRYMPMVRQIFAEERVPQDLAFLAVIESGFLNSAHSYAKAVGMWQFMRATGRIYGLSGNAWVEERMDPVKATRAAARYLRRLYELSGDWYLALVGYNAGPMTTERAIQNLGTRNFWDLQRSRWLRDQTKNYVPEMCAAVLVGRFPEKYGLNIEQLPPYAYETVEVDRMTSLPVLARFAGADVDALRELNPELLRATTPPGHYQLRVPPGTSGVTARALARIPASQRLDFKSYKIRKGDTLARVAAKFKVGAEDLLAANDLTKAQFRAGRVIKVPPPPPSPIDDRDLLPKAERATRISDQPLQDLPTIPEVRPPASTEEVSDGVPTLPPGEDLQPVPPSLPVPAGKPAADPHPKASATPVSTTASAATSVSTPALTATPVSTPALTATPPARLAKATVTTGKPFTPPASASVPTAKPSAPSAKPYARSVEPSARLVKPSPMAPSASASTAKNDALPTPASAASGMPPATSGPGVVPGAWPSDTFAPASGAKVRPSATPAPAVAEQTAAPAVAEQTAAPAVAEQPAAPAVAEQPAAPAVAEQTAARAVAERPLARPGRKDAGRKPGAPRPASHQVQKGDTLYALAARYGVSVKELTHWNKLKGNHLKTGQRLRLQP